jgi:hypothetical protein
MMLTVSSENSLEDDKQNAQQEYNNRNPVDAVHHFDVDIAGA